MKHRVDVNELFLLQPRSIRSEETTRTRISNFPREAISEDKKQKKMRKKNHLRNNIAVQQHDCFNAEPYSTVEIEISDKRLSQLVADGVATRPVLQFACRHVSMPDNKMAQSVTVAAHREYRVTEELFS